VSLQPGTVWLDAQGVQSVGSAERGIGRYIVEQIRALLEARPELIESVRLDPSRQVPPALAWLTGSGKLDVPLHRDAPPRGRVAIWHVTSPFELAIEMDRIWPYWARSGEVRTVVTLYDLIPLIFAETYLDPDLFTKAQYVARLGLVREAHQVLTISQFTAEDAMKHLGIAEDRITVIDSGVSSRISSLVTSSDEALPMLARDFRGLRPGFLLYVGGMDWRKNMEGTIHAYGRLPEAMRKAHQMVIICRLTGADEEVLMGYARSAGVDAADLLLPGFVEDAQLAALYRACHLFIFPSLYEGAGLPILEAMSCGAPVAASGTTSIPEILGDGEGTFDPANPEDIARCLRHVLDTPGKVEQLRERSAERVGLYTWERVAERTLDGYERALGIPVRSARRARRNRVALFTPWPPQASGVASHSRNLVKELSAYADIDVIAPDDPDIDLERLLEPGVTVRSESDAGWLEALRAYDRYVYTLGGSRFHAHSLEGLARMPGIVVAHDVRLIGAYLELHRRRYSYDVDWLEDRLVEMYGKRLSRPQLRQIRARHQWAEFELFMTQEMQRLARRILVHSNYQAGILRMDRGGGSGPPTTLVPFGIPAVPSVIDGSAIDGDPLLVSCGIVSLPLKRAELTIEGFARIAAERPGAQLIFIGEVSDADRATLNAIAARLGVSERVKVRGRVDDSEYWSTLGAADLALQLRTGINGGEASAAVADCIASGVPTIVSDIGWFAELPEPVVLRVPQDCSAGALAHRISAALGDKVLREGVRSAQADYAARNSFAKVAAKYAELLSL
jgi:glycosyltransferase involved in cell wall biosynthesis